jgi:AcrR family transcriptional regulator
VTATGVRRGRPRNEAIDAAILAATVDELVERGASGLSMESVAARAGVAKTTLYRRWPNSMDLIVDALRTFEQDTDDPPAGSVRDQLVWLIDAMRRKWNDPLYQAVMRMAVADSVACPEVYRAGRDRLVGPYIERLQAVLDRAADEGLIRADIDRGWVRQMMTAPIMAATLTHKGQVSRAQVLATIDTVLRGLAP